VHLGIKLFAGSAWLAGVNASLVIGLDRGDVTVAMTNRRVTIESVNGRVRRSISEEVNGEN
jgi:hypothetical protein